MSGQRSTSESPLISARRIVVKVGSALLVDPETGRLNRPRRPTLVGVLQRRRPRRHQGLLLSPGAIALGRRQLKLAEGALRPEGKQAAGAVGQLRLPHASKERLEE